MPFRTIIKTLLLLFVCSSVIYLIAGGRRENPEPRAAGDVTGQEAAPEAPSDARTGADGKQENRKPAFVAYYFHRDFRCQTCLRLEALCREAIENVRERELEEGTVEWRVINEDEPENEHFIERFGLYAQSLVIEEIDGGNPGKWKNLEEIWDLMEDRDRFMAYVEREVDLFLEEGL